MNKLLKILILFTMLSCIKEEEPIPKFDRGTAKSVKIEMGENYLTQIFYNIETNTIIKSIEKDKWDLGFSTEKNRIYLNSSVVMLASITNQNDFSEINQSSISLLQFDADKISYESDSLFLNKYIDNNMHTIIVLNLGKDINGIERGYMKLKILEITDIYYKIEYANINSNQSSIRTIYKNSSVNKVLFSFNDNQISEPDKNIWHLMFTTYTEIFKVDGDILPYSVNGVLINPYTVNNGISKEINFNKFITTDTSKINFTKKIDEIGYNWKYFNLDLNIYSIIENNCYILKLENSFLCKLTFTGFYNNEGKKGYPQFDYQLL